LRKRRERIGLSSGNSAPRIRKSRPSIVSKRVSNHRFSDLFGIYGEYFNGNIELMRLNLALAQISTHLGDVQANLDKHLAYIDRAREQRADLVVFPELSLTGYVLQDLVATVAHRPTEEDPIFRQLLRASHELDVVVGFVDEDTRHRFFIASAYLSGGRVLHVHHKVYLPTYGLFDEGRFFAWGDTVRAFDTRFGRAGLLICEDFWHASPPYLLWLDGADLMLFSSASPGRGLNDKEKLESARWVERVSKAYASMFTSFVAHCNRVGYEDGLLFWGGATVNDPNGELLAQGPYFEEALTLTELDLNQLRRTRARLPLLRDERTNLTVSELQRILHKSQ
jgi:predicted amidohydrolase